MSVSRKRFWCDTRGATAVMGALVAGLLCLVVAVATDLGAVAFHARKVQSAADLSALAAARDLGRHERAARATAEANLAGVEVMSVQAGLYRADARLAPTERFTPDADAPNAAEVRLRAPARLYFGALVLGRDSVMIERRARASVSLARPEAAFSIGSRLARLDGGLANSVLSELTGSRVSLTVMDYQALAGADISLLDYFDALASEMNLDLASDSAVMSGEISLARALGVLETLAQGRAASALSSLSRAAVADRSVRMVDVLDASVGSLRDSPAVRVSALDLASAMIEVAAGSRQVALATGAHTGLADTQIVLAIGERPNRSPWMTVSADGTPVIRTAQARLFITALTSQKLAGLAQVRLPLLVELAASEARLGALSCDGGRQVRLEARPGLARARLGDVDTRHLADFTREVAVQRATLMSVAGLVSIRAQADVSVSDLRWQTLSFNGRDIEEQRVKRVSVQQAASGLIASLLGRMEIEVNVVGLGLGLGNLARALELLVAPLGPVLDALVGQALAVAGLSIGEADLRVHALSCPGEHGLVPRLVG
ncbi:MAG: TadG family pilus assembly protein [Brevundimonas sp.]|jgi:uncharacterized membrane protein|uniref:TadG family pilus assembly protein n=1 Tax=Brevundimonas sp. TaxID=1871086 RepID=UPI003918A625